MQVKFAGIFFLALAACAPTVPDSAEGVGFNSLENYQQQRQSETVVAGPIQLGAEISSETVSPSGPEATTDALSTSTVIDITETTTDPTLPDRDTALISDEQDFDAVASRETIESDAERRATQQQAYQVITPTALPTRRGGTGPSIVEFALSTTNQVGQSIYQRANILAGNRYQRNCGKYPSSDLAQQAFLKNGGPQRDRKGIDPDGDGFACFWDPAPFRQAVRN